MVLIRYLYVCPRGWERQPDLSWLGQQILSGGRIVFVNWLAAACAKLAFVAAAGIHALDHHIDRLADDHANALRLAERLTQVKSIHVDPDLVETNMVFITLPDGAADGLRAHLAERGNFTGWGPNGSGLSPIWTSRVMTLICLSEEISSYFA